jgi:hypothetical protein
VRFFSAVLAVKTAVPHLRKGGSIVLTTGSTGEKPVGPGWAVSHDCAEMRGETLTLRGQVVSGFAAGLDGLTRGLALELSAQGLRVNCVSPGGAWAASVQRLPQLTACFSQRSTRSCGTACPRRPWRISSPRQPRRASCSTPACLSPLAHLAAQPDGQVWPASRDRTGGSHHVTQGASADEDPWCDRPSCTSSRTQTAPAARTSRRAARTWATDLAHETALAARPVDSRAIYTVRCRVRGCVSLPKHQLQRPVTGDAALAQTAL